MDDNKIIDMYWERDEGAIAASEAKYGRYCYAIAYRILALTEDASECVNDTWLGAWNSMPPHRPQILQTFLGRITRNLSLNVLRGRAADKRGGGETAASFDELEACIPDTAAIDAHLEAEELAKSLDVFLAGIGQEERRFFVCRYWYFDSIADIAKRYGCGESKVKMSLKRTRDRLKKHLEKEGILV
ncbi:MAG: sigma-70 family RNA polymerase sigma factor [Firmicutes bacterium]|nr:sigma-70 family RNA polymerase sigma factor [Bacillota bacterium]MBQ6663752.1 sigma-70 family RNA polymerase sigma factor [Bacillota bacterium]